MGFGMYGEAEVEVDMTLTPPEVTRADFIAIYAGSVTGMYVCVHIYTHVCMYVCMYVFMVLQNYHARMCMCVCMYEYLCMYVCIHVFT